MHCPEYPVTAIAERLDVAIIVEFCKTNYKSWIENDMSARKFLEAASRVQIFISAHFCQLKDLTEIRKWVALEQVRFDYPLIEQITNFTNRKWKTDILLDYGLFETESQSKRNRIQSKVSNFYYCHSRAYQNQQNCTIRNGVRGELRYSSSVLNSTLKKLQWLIGIFLFQRSLNF